MARARNIKPKFFLNETLAECSAHARLLFIGLWTICDGDGRMEDRPKRIKAEVFPYEDVDVDALLDELSGKDFVERYEVDGVKVVAVINFAKHQHPHVNEPKNTLPPKQSGVAQNKSELVQSSSGKLRQNRPLTESLLIESPIPLSESGASPAAPSDAGEREDLEIRDKTNGMPPTTSEAWSLVDACLDIREAVPPTLETDEMRSWRESHDKSYRLSVLALPPPVRKIFRENLKAMEDRKKGRSSKCGIFKAAYKEFLSRESPR